MDLTNPSPDTGWHNQERTGFFHRGPVDLVLALALVHHLAISNNLPLPMLSHALAALGRHLIIEFVPKEDSQAQRLLASREDIFPDYTIQGFRDAFLADLKILEEIPLEGPSAHFFCLKETTSVNEPKANEPTCGCCYQKIPSARLHSLKCVCSSALLLFYSGSFAILSSFPSPLVPPENVNYFFLAIWLYVPCWSRC